MIQSKVAILVLGLVIGSIPVFAYSYFQTTNLRTDLEGMKSTAQRDKQGLQDQVTELSRKSDELGSELQTRTNELSSKVQRIAVLDQTISQLQTEKSKIESDVTKLRADTANLEKEKSQLQQRDEALSAQIGSLLNQISALQQTITSLQSERINFQNQIGLLQKQVVSLNATITILKVQLNATKQPPPLPPPAPAPALMAAVIQHFTTLEAKDVPKLMTDYVQQGTYTEWKGQSGAFAGKYDGFGNVRILYASVAGNMDNIKIRVSNYKANITGDAALVTLTLDNTGHGKLIGDFTMKIDVVQLWVYRGAKWLILNEWWDYKVFKTELVAEGTVFPLHWRRLGDFSVWNERVKVVFP